MNVNEAMSIVSQLKSIVELADTFDFSREEVFLSILNVAENLKDLADDLDEAMYNELGHAYEKYDDALVIGG
jgi:hypothetical protein